eukprot:g49621.t1
MPRPTPWFIFARMATGRPEHHIIQHHPNLPPRREKRLRRDDGRTTPSHSSSATTSPPRINLVRPGRRRGEAASSSTASPTRTRTTMSTANTSTTSLPANTSSSWDYATANDVYDAAVERIRTSTTESCDDSTPLVAPQRYSIPTPAIDDGSIVDNEDTSYQLKNVFRRSGDRNSPPQPETAPAETTDYTTSPTSGSTTTGPDMAAATPTPRASQPVTESKTEATPPTPTLETAAKSYSIIDVHECFNCPTIKEVDLLQRTYNFTIGEKDWKKSFKKGCINNDWKSHKDYCKHASKPENKAALARYNQRAQSFDTLGMDLADKAVTDLGYRRLERYELGKGAILLNWDQLQQLPPGILNLTRTASLLDDDDAEANINVDGNVDNETTDDTHQEYYYHDIVKQGDYYPQERGGHGGRRQQHVIGRSCTIHCRSTTSTGIGLA